MRHMNYFWDSITNFWLPPRDTDIPPRATRDPTHLGRFRKGLVWHLLWPLEVRPELENINLRTRRHILQPWFWHQSNVWCWSIGITTTIYRVFFFNQMSGSVMSTLHILQYGMFTKSWWHRYHSCSHFTDEDNKAQGLSTLSKITKQYK